MPFDQKDHLEVRNTHITKVNKKKFSIAIALLLDKYHCDKYAKSTIVIGDYKRITNIMTKTVAGQSPGL